MKSSIDSKRAVSLLAIACALGACAPSQDDGTPLSVPGLSGAFPTASAGTPGNAATRSPTAPAPHARNLPTNLPDFTALVARQGPAVVNLIAIRSADSLDEADGAAPNPFGMLEPPGDEQQLQAVGSGVVISEDGLILTNAHVVSGASSVTVRLAEGEREYPARVIGADRPTDVALIKIEARGLPVADLGSSADVKPGEWVATIGSPFGFTNTITAGIVSATQRTLPDESFVSFIQTDVAVNPGNSGGPLLNLAGQVVGINSMIYSRTGGHMGVSFAIPIDLALDVARQLQAHGKVTRGSLGVGVQPMTPELAKAFKQGAPEGVLIGQVEPGSPAEKAGLQSGDVILSYGGKRVGEPGELPRIVADTRPGTAMKMEIWRDGARKELAATIGEMPATPLAAAPQAGNGKQPSEASSLVLSEVPQPLRERLGIEYGLLVMAIGGPLTDTPVRPGDVILAVNRQPFSSMEEFHKLILKERPGDSVALLVKRGERSEYAAFRVPPRDHMQVTNGEG